MLSEARCSAARQRAVASTAVGLSAALVSGSSCRSGLAVATVPVRPDRFRGATELAFDVPDQELGARGDDDGTYAEAGFKVTEVSFTPLNIERGKLQDGGWGGGFDLASTTPGRLFSLVSFEAKSRYGNPPGVTVYGYDAAEPDPVTSQVFSLTDTMTTYTLDPSFTHLSRVVFRNESDPEFNRMTVTNVHETPGHGRPARDPGRAVVMPEHPYPRRPASNPR